MIVSHRPLLPPLSGAVRNAGTALFSGWATRGTKHSTNHTEHVADLDDAQCAELMAMSQRSHAYEFIAR